MNQIPNIEETHNTKEGIEEIVDDFVARFSVNIADVKTTKELAKYWIRKTLLDLQDTHHQELQKAQESERERIKAFHEHECKKGDCTANNEGQWCCVEKYLRQSELDQPN